MERKDRIDAFGAVALTGLSLLFAFNQVVVKVTNDGLQPMFAAGLRSAAAALCVWAWMRFRGQRLVFTRPTILPGILVGLVFCVEFVGLFYALDYTSVARSAVIFYSMPVWLSLGAHVLLPGERMSARKALGLAFAMAGVGWALLSRDETGRAGLIGDLLALVGAWGWAGLSLLLRASPLRTLRPEMQNLWQLLVSAPVLLALAPLAGPLIRDLQPVHLWGLAFQIVAVTTVGFLLWIWLLSLYPASGVASFSFLSPLFGIGLGWLLLGEQPGPAVLAGGGLVAAGIALVNWPARRTPPG